MGERKSTCLLESLQVASDDSIQGLGLLILIEKFNYECKKVVCEFEYHREVPK